MNAPTQPVLFLPDAPLDNRFRLLLLEPDEILARQILGFLERTGFECHHALDSESGLSAFTSAKPHLLLTEALTEAIDGHAFCRWVREKNGIPILMLGPADETSEVAAFKVGADDYLASPLRPAVLMARVVAHLRRAYRYNAPAKTSNPFGLPLVDETISSAGQPRLPTGWAECELCAYRGPRWKFETEDFFGNSKMGCPNCKETDHIVFSLD